MSPPPGSRRRPGPCPGCSPRSRPTNWRPRTTPVPAAPAAAPRPRPSPGPQRWSPTALCHGPVPQAPSSKPKAHLPPTPSPPALAPPAPAPGRAGRGCARRRTRAPSDPPRQPIIPPQSESSICAAPAAPRCGPPSASNRARAPPGAARQRQHHCPRRCPVTAQPGRARRASTPTLRRRPWRVGQRVAAPLPQRPCACPCRRALSRRPLS
jgi:hypothetical protein